MRSILTKSALAALLLAFFVGCGQPPTPPGSDIEVSDENNNTVTTQAIPTNGLKGDYYDNVDFTGTLKTRYDATINKAWNSSAPITGIQPTTYSVRWTGQIMPAFSETYTFTLSYADGARLMVNGQVLVNDWVDGAKRTKTGTVALQANTKYDIRLEYYRNATNAGAVKLEWQSSSRSRQVVPQASLYVAGSDTQTSLTALVQNANVQAKGLTFSALDALTQKDSNGNFSLFAKASGGKGLILATLEAGSVKNALYISSVGSETLYEDLLTGQKVNLGNLAQYKRADGTVSVDDARGLVVRLLPMISRGAVLPTGAGTTPASAGGLRPQYITDLFPELCNHPVIPPPAYCTDQNCIGEANTYKDAVCALGAMYLEFGIGGIALEAGPFGQAIWVATKFVLGGASPTDIVFQEKRVAAAWANYLKCINGEKTVLVNGQTIPVHGCPPVIDEPLAIEINASLNSVGSRQFEVGNASYPRSQGALEIALKLEGSNVNGDTINTLLLGLYGQANGAFSLRVTPGSSKSFTLGYTCPSRASEWRGNVVIAHNAIKNTADYDAARPVLTRVVIRCADPSKIAVTPNPLSLVAAINSATTGTLTVSNTGTAPLEVSGVASNQGWLTVPTTGFTVAPGSSQSVTVQGTCDAIASTKPSATVTFSSDATTGSSSAAVTLNCAPSQQIKRVVIGQLNWKGRFGGYSSASCTSGIESVVGYILSTPVISEYSPDGVSHVYTHQEGEEKDCDGNIQVTVRKLLDRTPGQASGMFTAWKSRAQLGNRIIGSPKICVDDRWLQYSSFGDQVTNQSNCNAASGTIFPPGSQDMVVTFVVDVINAN
jgi:PA14 domain